MIDNSSRGRSAPPSYRDLSRIYRGRGVQGSPRKPGSIREIDLDRIAEQISAFGTQADNLHRIADEHQRALGILERRQRTLMIAQFAAGTVLVGAVFANLFFGSLPIFRNVDVPAVGAAGAAIAALAATLWKRMAR